MAFLRFYKLFLSSYLQAIPPQIRARRSESLANGSTGNYDEDSTLDKSVMDSKAFNEDVYIKCANEKENALKEPKMSSNGFEIDW